MPEPAFESNEPVVLINGDFFPASKLHVPVHDQGYVHGVTISERIRTFNHKLFLLDEHLDRWQRSIELIGGKSSKSDMAALREQLQELVVRNVGRIDSEHDLAVCMIYSPGLITSQNPAWSNLPESSEEKIIAYTYPLGCHWAKSYNQGVTTVISSHQEVPAECWRKGMKIRSRAHYYLANKEAHQVEPNAAPILLDAKKQVRDSSIAGLIFFNSLKKRAVSPPRTETFNSISVDYAATLLVELGYQFEFDEIPLSTLTEFDDAVLCSTPWCVLPISKVMRTDGYPFVEAYSSDVARALIDRWSQKVNVPIVEQAIAILKLA